MFEYGTVWYRTCGFDSYVHSVRYYIIVDMCSCMRHYLYVML